MGANQSSIRRAISADIYQTSCMIDILSALGPINESTKRQWSAWDREFPFTNGHFLFNNKWELSFTKNNFDDGFVFILQSQKHGEILSLGIAKILVNDKKVLRIELPLRHCKKKCKDDICVWYIGYTCKNNTLYQWHVYRSHSAKYSNIHKMCKAGKAKYILE